MKTQARRRPRFIRLLLVLSVLILLPGERCPDPRPALNLARAELRSILGSLEHPPRMWRVLWKPVPRGTVISTFDFLSTGDLPTYQCHGWCVLFFLDLDPYAHFAHPTRILVFDSEPEEGDAHFAALPPSEWWPTIRKPSSSHAQSIFNTVESREDFRRVLTVGRFPGELPALTPDTVFMVAESPSNERKPVSVPAARIPLPTPSPGPPPGAGPGGQTGCEPRKLPVWAIVVNGFYDASDTFDEDVSGMVRVLRGFGVDDERIQCVSSVPIPGIGACLGNSKSNLDTAFAKVRLEMEECATPGVLAPDVTPQVLVFWSSHGSSGALTLDASDSMRDFVWASDLMHLIKDLEGAWAARGTRSNPLEVAVVIEACESGSVGVALHTAGPQWRIFTSAWVSQPSYRDIDGPVGNKQDPNPADVGSETIGGYVEAFGTAAADANGDGRIDFVEAADYAETMDVTANAGAGPYQHTIGFWTPTPADPVAVHGAWNTSDRRAGSVIFTSRGPRIKTDPDGVPTLKVHRCKKTDIGVKVANLTSADEVGALALRIFHNRESAPDNWNPMYYKEDDLRTTEMLSGLAAGDGATIPFNMVIPGSFTNGEKIRLAVTLDSAQAFAQTDTAAAGMNQSEGAAATQAEPRSELTIVVEDTIFSDLVCLWNKIF